jgi:hypothetical protein
LLEGDVNRNRLTDFIVEFQDLTGLVVVDLSL